MKDFVDGFYKLGTTKERRTTKDERAIHRSIDRPCGTPLDAKALCSFDSSIGYSFFLDKWLENGGRGGSSFEEKSSREGSTRETSRVYQRDLIPLLGCSSKKTTRIRGTRTDTDTPLSHSRIHTSIPRTHVHRDAYTYTGKQIHPRANDFTLYLRSRLRECNF